MLFITSFSPLDVWGQDNSQTGDIRIQIADFRGRGFDSAGIAALSASEKGVVVLLVCGADQDVIDETEAALKGLIRDGYSRVAMLLADPIPEKDTTVVAIVAGGDSPSYMKGVFVHARYRADLYVAVKEAYEDFILSVKKN